MATNSENHAVHPSNPPSNVPKLGAYDPNKYTISLVPVSVLTDESLTPGREPVLTQRTIGMYLQPLTRELVELPVSPTVAELPDAVIENLVQRDKAFWVDKPGVNAYTLHDAYYNCEMSTEKVLPPHQDVFPRSYEYDLDCIKYRHRHACDGLKQSENKETAPLAPLAPHCRDCSHFKSPGLTPFQLAWAHDAGQKRWRYYPDLNATFTTEEIRQRMNEVGRPFHHEACVWYNKNYPSVKHDVILRKFSK